ncbi:MAG: hypothetical protein EZS28_034723 [Streblomastix strix]|uniref:Uncharacterized protein n=1 Tax=Streblomastix strix TaxID=222440 RepID=A0A5J4UID8_9EUKA|nr:MAG: hypothetical protein EZS28_034723 [Streblomastix strix]
MVKKIRIDKYDVDIFACVDAYFNEDSKGSLRNIVQPGTRIRDKVKDTIKGQWKSKTEEIFTYKDINDIYNKKDLSTLPEVFEIFGFDMDVLKYHEKPDIDEILEQVTDMMKEQAEILINKLNNLVVHNYAKRSATESTLFVFFSLINGLKGIAGVDDELSWFSAIVQHPEIQTRASIILRGSQGCGKNTFTDVMSELLSGYSLRNITSLTSVT